MHRRGFLKNTSIAGLGAQVVNKTITNLHKKYKEVLLVKDETDLTDLNEITINILQEKMAKGQLTSRKITEIYINRINEIDKNGPKLNSVIELNPEAISIAEKMDKERKMGKIRSPLHGIPVLVKDNINTADKMQTTAGSLALEGHFALNDAFIIKKLRESGAVLLGKTNLSEWANFRSSRSSSGWSSRGGQTNNPYNPSRSPCGSSSGSGVAVAANLCTVAIGTETDGSIVCPSSVNGIVGIKPTVGLISRNGIIPISKTQDTAGPMARTVTDAALLLAVLSGIDTSDSATLESKDHVISDYSSFLQKTGLRGKRLGIDKSLIKGHEAIDNLFQKALSILKQEGATIIEVDVLSKMKELGNSEFLVLQYEFKDGLNKYLASENAQVKSLKDVIAYNKMHESKAMPYFKQETLESSEEKGDLNSKEYLDAVHKNTSVSRAAIDNAINENKLDAIIGPTTGPTWCTDLVNGDHYTGYDTSTPAAVAGYPHITVPMGLVFGLPVGLSFIGTAYSESKLITVAYDYEQASKNRIPPKF